MVIVNIQPKKDYVRPLIDEKPYLGRCIEIDEFKDQEGNAKININLQYKKENVTMKFVFEVLDLKTKEPVMYDGNPVKITQFAPYKSRNQGETEWNVIIGNPKSRITPILAALGMEFKSDVEVNYDLDELVGKEVKLYIKDHLKTNPDGTEETFSIINDITKLNQRDLDNMSKSSVSNVQPKSKVVTNNDGDEIEEIDLSGEGQEESEIEKKTKDLKQQFKDGLITEAGLKKSLESLGVPDELDNIDLGDD